MFSFCFECLLLFVFSCRMVSGGGNIMMRGDGERDGERERWMEILNLSCGSAEVLVGINGGAYIS